MPVRTEGIQSIHGTKWNKNAEKFENVDTLLSISNNDANLKFE
jgi:hypothetical protein